MKTLFLAIAMAFPGTFLSASAPTTTERGMVYICNSKSARAYHASSDCRGLNRCKYNPEQVSESTAERRGLRPCKICY